MPGLPSLSEDLGTVRRLANTMPQMSCPLLSVLRHYQEFEATRVLKSAGDHYELALSYLLGVHIAENYENLDKNLYRELVTACQSPDSTVDSIIRAAVEMVKVYRPPVTPRSAPSSAGSASSGPSVIDLDTPVKTSTYLSQSVEGRKLDDLIFKEMEYHVYRGIDGFFKTHYNRKDWSQEQRNAYKAVLKRHKNGAWKGFPSKPEEAPVKAWLTELLREVASESKYIMDSNLRANETDDDVNAQMDIFFRERGSDGERPTHFTYGHVLAVGEHKLTHDSSSFKEVFLQLAKHAHYIHRAQPERLFIHAFTLTGTVMELWVFDSAGGYSSGEFDIHSNDGKIKFATAIIALVTMDGPAMGLNSKIQGENVEMTSVDGGSITVTLGEPIYSQRSMTGRGTSCWKAKISTAPQEQSPTAKKAKTVETQFYHVVKAAWRIDRRKPTELEILHELKNPEGVVKLLGYIKMATISDWRKRLKFSDKNRHRFQATEETKADNFDPRERRDNEFRRRLKGRRRSERLAAQANSQGEAEQDLDCYDDRTLIYIVVSPMGVVLTELTDPLDIMTAGRGAAIGLKYLFENNWLHRDVSPTNIILSVQGEKDPERGLEERDGERTGLLIDLDVARRADRPSVSGAMQRTGSRIYTAIGVLKGETHTYRHDVESLFYSLLDMCSRLIWETPEFRDSQKKPRKFWTTDWLEDTDENAAKRKTRDMTTEGLKLVMENFPKSFKPIRSLFRDLRTHIFGAGEPANLEKREGIREDPEAFFQKLVSTFDSAIQRYCKNQSEIGRHST